MHWCKLEVRNYIKSKAKTVPLESWLKTNPTGEFGTVFQGETAVISVTSIKFSSKPNLSTLLLYFERRAGEYI